MHAYEQDFHYALTKWLAMRAGFCDADAETIARGAIAPDEDARAAVGSVYRAIANGDMQASRTVQEWHFPGTGPVPGLQQARRVAPGSNAALQKVRAAVQGGTLTAFGEALHPLQDSWAHGGLPGYPFGFFLTAWGHPEDRGGWRQHYADQTYLDSASALAAAEATYTSLMDFKQAQPRRDCSSAPPFSALRSDVLEFASIATKSEKRQWFSKRISLGRPDIFGAISLAER
jgi:hypothetical protein